VTKPNPLRDGDGKPRVSRISSDPASPLILLFSFDALEWLAAMCSHVPDKGEHMVRYYGYYSNVSRGKRNKQNQDGLIPCILEADVSKKRCQKSWARLIPKMYEVDPLVCPKCNGQRRITSLLRPTDLLPHGLA
jgi:hypothetical protein